MRVFGVAGTLIPAGRAAGTASQVGRLSETAIAFARSCSCGIETPVAFASLCPCEVETGVAFAGEKRVFLARFSVADVLLVSALPFCCVLCAKKFALLGLVWV